MESLGAQWARAWMRRAAADIAARRIDLIELDRAIGDGDHGENMDRGFAAVRNGLDEGAQTPSDVLRAAATTLISTVGGAAGPLYGTALLRAAKAVAGTPGLDGEGVVALLEAGLTGIQDRGRATEGEKTMVDAWAPATAAARERAGSGGGAVEVLVAAARAAAAGAAATAPMVATKGRASYLGERSAGHRDPGAESSWVILASAAIAAGADPAGVGEGQAE